MGIKEIDRAYITLIKNGTREKRPYSTKQNFGCWWGQRRLIYATHTARNDSVYGDRPG